MRGRFALTVGFAGLLSAGFLMLDQPGLSEGEGWRVERVHANLLRVRVEGKWEEFPLLPLADHLCRSHNRLFERYCGDDLIAPEPHK